ncbi:hypothetical protein ABIA32_002729 [Streptacidiphilus sp. MAP12-20]|uniref:hypothetical protein n=1 Tax=Streptacidiphilus sp. MAP12-20 TaxID=3156299 RepID=UPI0035122E98
MNTPCDSEHRKAVTDLALDAAVRILDQQGNMLDSLRTRAGGLLAVSALGTSFGAALGRFHVAHSAIPGKAFAALVILLLVLVAYFSFSILGPTDWHVGVDPKAILEYEPGTCADAKATLVFALAVSAEANDKTLNEMSGSYDLCIILLVVQMASIVVLSFVR